MCLKVTIEEKVEYPIPLGCTVISTWHDCMNVFFSICGKEYHRVENNRQHQKTQLLSPCRWLWCPSVSYEIEKTYRQVAELGCAFFQAEFEP